ncbi:hypothetical protein MKX01_006281 [Papaver californicum]|nr:hypothetical protein MKX01_006281 [Papaver californicum]
MDAPVIARLTLQISLDDCTSILELTLKSNKGPVRRACTFTLKFLTSSILFQALGIKEFLPAYNDPSLGPNDLLTGVSFASGAAGYDPLTSKLATAISMEKQIDLFREYIAKVTAIGGEEKAKSIVSESVYLVVAGSDDLANTYFASKLRNDYDIPAYTGFMVEGASSFIQEELNNRYL